MTLLSHFAEVDVQLETEQTENRLLRDQLEGERVIFYFSSFHDLDIYSL